VDAPPAELFEKFDHDHFRRAEEISVFRAQEFLATQSPALTTITSLNLARSNVTDDDLRFLSCCRNLESLSLSRTRLSSHGLSHLATLDRLQHLDLSLVRTLDPAGLASLSDLRNLRGLDLSHTRVDTRVVPYLITLPSLQELRLEGTRLTSDGIATLRKHLPTCDITQP
jgi:hypothetical protein